MTANHKLVYASVFCTIIMESVFLPAAILQYKSQRLTSAWPGNIFSYEEASLSNQIITMQSSAIVVIQRNANTVNTT